MNRAKYTALICGGALAAVILSSSVAKSAADKDREITLPGTRVFPESITSTSDGTLIVGSLGHNEILRIEPGTTEAKVWIKAGTGGLNSVLGVYADEKSKLLWVCSNKLAETGEATSLKTFDLKSGVPKNTYVVPGEPTFCNDIAIGADRTAYITDTRQGIVFMLKPGATALEIAVKDPLLASADGLAFGNKTTLYVNGVTTGKLLRLELAKDGKATKVVELKLPRTLEHPDGMRTIGNQRLLLAENSGKMSIVTFGEADLQTVSLQALKEGMPPTPAVTATKGMAWVVEGKLNYLNDAAWKDKDPGSFKLYAVPLPKK